MLAKFTKLKPIVPLSFVFAAALLFAVLAPEPAYFGLVDSAPFEFPPALYAVLIGFFSSILTAGLKNRFPDIANALALLISALVTTGLGLLTGLITTGIPAAFWPILLEGVELLISWIAAWGSYVALFKRYEPISAELQVDLDTTIPRIPTVG